MWSGRLREPLDARFEQWQRSFPFDWRLLREELAASAAHAKMLAAAGVLSVEELGEIEDGLESLAEVKPHTEPGTAGTETVKRDDFEGWGRSVADLHPGIEDIHHYVEATLLERIGPLALKLHTGRSRNEQIATDLRLFARHACDHAAELLRGWAETLLAQAEIAGRAVMPAYTHLQRAEPVLVAHWLLAYVAMAERDVSRVADCRARMNLCPLGSGPVAGATLALDREIAARELGFAAPTANSMDATSDRDFVLEFLQTAQQIGLHLSRFAEEIILFSTAEYGFVALPDTYATGSSAMPQKKNPDLPELLRGKAGRLTGAAVTVAMILKGQPLAYNKDMQETQHSLFDTVDTLLSLLSMVAPFTAALHFNTERTTAAATSGYLNAMAAATYLVSKGVPFRTAHEQVGAAVRHALERRVELQDLSVAELQQFGPAFADDFYAAVTLEATIDCHDVYGGTATARVEAALQSAKLRLQGNPEQTAREVTLA